MANRKFALYYGRIFMLLAHYPSALNKMIAQQLYQVLFGGMIKGYCDLDFHVGEMECLNALLTLEIERYRDDEYLAIRGDFAVLEDDDSITKQEAFDIAKAIQQLCEGGEL